MIADHSVKSIVDELDPEQREAVLAPSGPLCILAGAGTGKTRTITHRIAHRVATGEIQPGHVLAVTFTARAAGEMRSRLKNLGAGNVSVRTFHAAALRQLRFFAPRILGGRDMPRLVEAKAPFVVKAGNLCRLHLEKTTVRDVAAEIEWAKSTLVEPEEYVVAATKANRALPLPAENITALYSAYEKVKSSAGVIDFEDMLRAMVWAVEQHRDVAEQIRAQYRHFVVDEYQDVNPLQQRLLDAWLSGRKDLCVVGDVSQTIYSFTGATAEYLVDFPRRYEGASVVRLERNYRSSPQVVAAANGIIAAASGPYAALRVCLASQNEDGPPVRSRQYDNEEAEAYAVARRCKELMKEGMPPSQIAVLFRINAQSVIYENALTFAKVPYVVRGAERFFERPEVRQAIILLRGAAKAADTGDPEPVSRSVAAVLSSQGFDRETPPQGGAKREVWEALAAIVRLAEEFEQSHPASTLMHFAEELTHRADNNHVPVVEGVTLASLHASKGLEWDAVFLVGMVEGSVPISYATTDEQVEEERRLAYVGATRARTHLWLSWGQTRNAGGRQRRRSRFLSHLPRK